MIPVGNILITKVLSDLTGKRYFKKSCKVKFNIIKLKKTQNLYFRLATY